MKNRNVHGYLLRASRIAAGSKNWLLLWSTLIGITVAFPIEIAFAQTAKDIVEKTDKKRLGNTSESTISITVIRPTWQREMSLKVWSKGGKYLLILITEPARDKGTAFLKSDKEGRFFDSGDTLWWGTRLAPF